MWFTNLMLFVIAFSTLGIFLLFGIRIYVMPTTKIYLHSPKDIEEG